MGAWLLSWGPTILWPLAGYVDSIAYLEPELIADPGPRNADVGCNSGLFASPAASRLTSQPSASPPDMDAVALGNRSASCKDAGTKPKTLSPPVARESDPYPLIGNPDPPVGGSCAPPRTISV